MLVTTPNSDTEIQEKEDIDELAGKLGLTEQGLMHSVIENDQQVIEQGKMLEQALNHGMSSFTPDMMFQHLVQNYKKAKDLYGERMISALSGYDEQYVEKNIKIPEFQREIKQHIEEGMKSLKKQELLDDNNQISQKGIELASLTLYMAELDNIKPKGMFGEYEHTKTALYGIPKETKSYRKGDRYKDIALKKSVKTAIRRGHTKLAVEDLQVFQRHAKGQTSIIYAIDASGSMKGKKIHAAKKAGIALAYTAIQKNDNVGLVVFKDEVVEEIEPTQDFGVLLQTLTKITASRQTDFVKTIEKSIELFPADHSTKHLVLITDALPTTGSNPEKESVQAVAQAYSLGITVSLLGITIDDQAVSFAREIVELGKGQFYRVQDLENVQQILLEDYHAFSN